MSISFGICDQNLLYGVQDTSGASWSTSDARLLAAGCVFNGEVAALGLHGKAIAERLLKAQLLGGALRERDALARPSPSTIWRAGGARCSAGRPVSCILQNSKARYSVA